MNESKRIKNNLLCNKKWIERDLDERQKMYRKNGNAFKKKFNIKSPEMIFEDDELKWKKPTKDGWNYA